MLHVINFIFQCFLLIAPPIIKAVKTINPRLMYHIYDMGDCRTIIQYIFMQWIKVIGHAESHTWKQTLKTKNRYDKYTIDFFCSIVAEPVDDIGFRLHLN